MDELFKIVTWVHSYLGALQTAIDKTMAVAPTFISQEMKKQVTRKIDTRSGKGGESMSSIQRQYFDAIKIKTEGSVLIVELDSNNWLANALESGVGAFDMKPGLLTQKSGKPVKRSKAGFRYRVIPIRKHPGSKSSERFHTSTKSESKESIYQSKINEVLKKPQFGKSQLKTMIGGKIVETQKIINKDPLLGGFYRTRTFESAQHFHAAKGRPDWQFVMFRTVSENPSSSASWRHPGITAHHIFKSTEFWIDNTFQTLLKKEMENFIQEEMQKVGAL